MGMRWGLGLTFAAVIAVGACGDAGDGPCPAGRVSCLGACVDLMTDPRNCGGCGITCRPGVACFVGACSRPCESPWRMCGNFCVDVAADNVNCGSCGNRCPTGLYCMGSRCEARGNPCGSRTCGPDGRGGDCGQCAPGLQCNREGLCELDPSSRWILTVGVGTVASTAAGGAWWDAFGNGPDPMVCATINGQTYCTPAGTDTYSLIWDFSFPATTAGALQAGIAVQFLDADTGSAPDRICPDAVFMPGRAIFVAGGGRMECNQGTWSYTLRPAP